MPTSAAAQPANNEIMPVVHNNVSRGSDDQLCIDVTFQLLGPTPAPDPDIMKISRISIRDEPQQIIGKIRKAKFTREVAGFSDPALLGPVSGGKFVFIEDQTDVAYFVRNAQRMSNSNVVRLWAFDYETMTASRAKLMAQNLSVKQEKPPSVEEGDGESPAKKRARQ